MEVCLSQNREEEENRILPPAGVRAIHGADAPGMPAVLKEGKVLAPLLLLLLRSADALSAAALCRSTSAAPSSKKQ